MLDLRLEICDLRCESDSISHLKSHFSPLISPFMRLKIGIPADFAGANGFGAFNKR